MAHNRDRRPVYPTERETVKPQKRRGKWWKWVLFLVLLFTPLLCLLVPDIVDDCRLHRSNIETTAYIKELYKSGKGHNIRIVYEKGNPSNSNWVGYYKK